MFKRFISYIDKVFDFNEKLSKIKDTRKKPHIKTKSVLLSSFVMLTTRLGSLNALDTELHLPKKLANLIGKVKHSVDTIGRVYTKIITEDVRKFHWDICRVLKRNKVINTPLALSAIAVDGHEFFSHQKQALGRLL